MYAQWIFQRDPALLPSKQELPKTHTLLGKIRCTDKDAIFEALQGNAWSPDGEAYTLIRENGLDHTTMRSADALVINGEALFCSHMGWISMRNDETVNNRAESNQDNSPQERRCTKCGKTGVPLKKCSRCKNAYYSGLSARKETGTSTSPPVMLNSPLIGLKGKRLFLVSRCVLAYQVYRHFREVRDFNDVFGPACCCGGEEPQDLRKEGKKKVRHTNYNWMLGESEEVLGRLRGTNMS